MLDGRAPLRTRIFGRQTSAIGTPTLTSSESNTVPGTQTSTAANTATTLATGDTFSTSQSDFSLSDNPTTATSAPNSILSRDPAGVKGNLPSQTLPASHTSSDASQSQIGTAGANGKLNSSSSSTNPSSGTIPINTSITFPSTSTGVINNLPHTDSSRSWILPIAVTIPLLISLVVLYLLYARRMRKLRGMLLPHVDSHDGRLGPSAGHGVMEPFDVLQNQGSTEERRRVVEKGSPPVHIDNMAARGPPASLERKAQRVPETVSDREIEDSDGPDTEEPRPQHHGDPPLASLIQRDDDVVDPRTRSSLVGQVEALQERLRVMEDIALRSVHNPRREDASNLEREIRDLIPPPEYTGPRAL